MSKIDSPRYSTLRRLMQGAFMAAGLIGVVSQTVYAQVSIKEPPLAVAEANQKYQKVFPGIYTDRERGPVKDYLAANRALRERGPIDVQKLIRGELPKNTPGLGPVIRVTEDWVRYNNNKLDPDNPLGTDSRYARQAGFADILAFPSFGANDDVFMVPYPGMVRDRLLVSELNHSITSYRPIHPGDTLYLVANDREVIDLTPVSGSVYRSVAINTHGSIYNQRGEKVNDVIFRVTENVKQLKDPKDAPKNPSFMDIWEAPDWLSRPAHVYTDADWDRIKTIWRNEKRQGATPLYWEDVQVGDRPTWTLEGPVMASVSPVKPWGMGSGGSRTLKREILDPELSKSLIRGAKDGIWRTAQRSGYIPQTPPQPFMDDAMPPMPEPGGIVTTDIHKDGEKRSPLVNYMGRDFAIRHLTNWMGDKGWLHNIRWSIMDPRGHAAHGMPVPSNPAAEHFLDRVPSMKGRFVEVHGLTQDVALVKSEVVGKSVRNGESFAELVWWIETIDGKVWEEGAATVKLPTKTQR